jgi:hypothetical protein
MPTNMNARISLCQRYAVLVAVFLLSAVGCASLGETGKKIWGTSIAHLQSARADARVLTVSGSRDAVYDQIKKTVQAVGAKVYLEPKDRAYLAAMRFKGHVDTTEVGIFLTALGDQKTKVEVASMSPRLANEVAALISQDPGITVVSEKGEGA